MPREKAREKIDRGVVGSLWNRKWEPVPVSIGYVVFRCRWLRWLNPCRAGADPASARERPATVSIFPSAGFEKLRSSGSSNNSKSLCVRKLESVNLDFSGLEVPHLTRYGCGECRYYYFVYNFGMIQQRPPFDLSFSFFEEK